MWPLKYLQEKADVCQELVYIHGSFAKTEKDLNQAWTDADLLVYAMLEPRWTW